MVKQRRREALPHRLPSCSLYPSALETQCDDHISNSAEGWRGLPWVRLSSFDLSSLFSFAWLDSIALQRQRSVGRGTRALSDQHVLPIHKWVFHNLKFYTAVLLVDTRKQLLEFLGDDVLKVAACELLKTIRDDFQIVHVLEKCGEGGNESIYSPSRWKIPPCSSSLKVSKIFPPSTLPRRHSASALEAWRALLSRALTKASRDSLYLIELNSPLIS